MREMGSTLLSGRKKSVKSNLRGLGPALGSAAQVVTFGDSATYWAPEPLPVCDFLWPGHDTDSKRVRTGQTQATAPHTRPP